MAFNLPAADEARVAAAEKSGVPALVQAARIVRETVTAARSLDELLDPARPAHYVLALVRLRYEKRLDVFADLVTAVRPIVQAAADAGRQGAQAWLDAADKALAE